MHVRPGMNGERMRSSADRQRNSGGDAGADGAAASPADGAPARSVDLAALRRMAGFNIHMIDLLQYQLFYEQFGGKGFTPAVYSTLLTIRENPGIRHGALADALMVQRPNMTTLLNSLERDGYVSRKPSPDDKRWVVLSLTEQGERAVAQMREAMMSLEKEVLSVLAPAERKTLLTLLQKLSEGASRLPRRGR
jgi:DNA-binding MarR family transcriptional regulator